MIYTECEGADSFFSSIGKGGANMSSMDDTMILLMDEKRKVTAVLHIVISNTYIYIYVTPHSGWPRGCDF